MSRARNAAAIAKVVRGGRGVGFESGGKSRVRGARSVGLAQSLKREKLLSDDHEREMVMKAGPCAPFVVVQAKHALGFLMVSLDPPAQACERDQRHDVRVGR